MIASQAVRVAPVRHPAKPRPRHTHAMTRRAAHSGTTWEVRAFVTSSVAICAVFLLVVLYLAQATAVAARGYEAQRLERNLAEIRRQNALLEVENARLDAPARIEVEARKIGLVRLATIPVVQAEPLAANR